MPIDNAQNGPATHDHGGGGKRVTELMHEGASNIQVVGRPKQKPGDDAIHHHAGRRHPDHDFRVYLNRMAEPQRGFIKDVKRDEHQREGVHKGREHARAVVAVSFGSAGRARLNEDSNPGEQQSQQIGYVVSRFGEQRQAVRAQSCHQRHQHVGERRCQRVAQRLGAHGGMGMGLTLHILSLPPRAGLLRIQTKRIFQPSLAMPYPI